MIPTDTQQYEAATTGRVPPPSRVRKDVWEIPQRMPAGKLAYSFCYIFGDDNGGLHVVDPGWDSDENWATLVSALTAFGLTLGDVATIIATHLHPDHIGMAHRLQTATGAQLVMHEAEYDAAAKLVGRDWSGGLPEEVFDEWEVPVSRRSEFSLPRPDAFQPCIPEPDRLVRDGDLLEIPGAALRIILTSGHTRGHICLVDETRSLIITGDHVLPTTYAGLGLGGRSTVNPLADYVDSLDAIAAYDECEVLPGHGYRFRGLAQRCRQSKEHQLRRAREMAAVLSSTVDSSVWHLASQLTWGGGWERLQGFHLYSALSQTVMHRDYVRSRDV